MNPSDAVESIELDVFRCPLNGVNQIEASAGTGKTWNICALYVRLLLEKNLTAEQILVVTFTKAATAELQQRIRQRLMDLEHALTIDHAGDDPFIQGLFESWVDSDAGALRAEPTLRTVRRALHDFDQAAIHTIHGFCQRALAEAPFAAGLPFESVATADDQLQRFEVANEFWRTRVEPLADAEPWLAAWLVANGAGPTVLLDQLRRRLTKPLARLQWDNLDLQTLRPNASAARQHFNTARELWHREAEAIAEVLRAALPHLNRTTHKETTLQAAQAAWTQHFAQDDWHRPLPKEAFKLTARALQKATKARGVSPQHRFFDLAEALGEMAEELDAYGRHQWLTILREFLGWGPEALRERKRARREISFDDMLGSLHRALVHHPWMAVALRERYPAALIDEFQDTDPLQFDIFSRIFAPDGPMFLVGDPKQAIYGFRAADLHTYLEAGRQAQARYSLAVNQRSSAGLIDACNRLFSVNPHGFILDGLHYQTVRPGVRRRPPLLDRASAAAALTSAAAQTADLRVWWLPDAPVLGKAQAMAAAAAASAAEIVRLLRGAAIGSVQLGEQPLAPGDIAVLVQTHRQGSLIKRVLMQWGVGSVEMAQASVFATVDAEQFERVLLAVDTPGDVRRLRTALATDWFAIDATALAMLDAGLAAGFDASIAAKADRTETDSTRSAAVSTAAGAAEPGEPDIATWIERFTRYRGIWHERGFAPMWRVLLRDAGIERRLARLQDGERRLTDLGHLTELIQARSVTQPGIGAVLRWFAAQRAGGSNGLSTAIAEDAQLRLESDRNLVQIVTVHRAKGLEYAVVFCPFLNDGRTRPSSRGGLPDAHEYHDDDGNAVLDFSQDAAVAERAREANQLEQAAERVRLIYVALTRAIYRCYLVAGPYAQGAHGSVQESNRALLNWLVAGQRLDRLADRVTDEVGGERPPEGGELAHLADAATGVARRYQAWLNATPETDQVQAAWQALAVGTIELEALPVPGPVRPLERGERAENLPQARPAQRRLRDNWRTASFSSIVMGLGASPIGQELRESLPDHDAQDQSQDQNDQALAAVRPIGVAPTPIGIVGLGPAAVSLTRTADDILDFPRGAAPGESLHRLLELARFDSREGWFEAAQQALQERPPLPGALARRDGAGAVGETRAEIPPERLAAMMVRLLADLTTTELVPGLRLAEIDPARRLNELAFLFPSAQVDLSQLRSLLCRHGLPDIALEGTAWQGYLRGFVDSIFEHDGRFWIVDWKSNFLGTEPTDYDRVGLDSAMTQHAYHLQALIYTVALHRYLKFRLPDYDYEVHFGGCLYLFIRGVRPTWLLVDPELNQPEPAGVHFSRAAPALLGDFEALLLGVADDV